MINPLRPLRARLEDVLGMLGVLEDARQTVGDHRTTRAGTKALAATDRATALRTARRGCNHSPACPPATAADRQKAEVVWRDAQFIYLCNGLTLSARDHVPDFPPFTPTWTDADTEPKEATRP